MIERVLLVVIAASCMCLLVPKIEKIINIILFKEHFEVFANLELSQGDNKLQC